MKKNKGITLIALIITIVILLILAGITIAMLTGENGILNKANSAKTETVKKGALEKVNLAIAGSFDNSGKIDDIQLKTNLENVEGIEKPIPNPITYPLTVKVEGINIEITKNENEYTKAELKESGGKVPPTIVDGIPIPGGFYHVGGNISEGFVISDNRADTNKDINGELIGNQFIWIPVNNSTEENFRKIFKRTDGYYFETLQSIYISDTMTDIFTTGESDGDGNNKYLQNNGIEESDVTKQESKEMYTSVKKNGGFYLARYESGNEHGKVVSKKGVTPWVSIPWSNSIDMNVDTGGAVEKARELTKQNNYINVKSTLCYKVQWDAALNYIDPNYITNEKDGLPNCDKTSFVRNSQGIGNLNEDENNNVWQGNVTTTGASIDYQIKNIYDLAGNVLEWTMESHNTNCRVLVGGSCQDHGSSCPASYRTSATPTGQTFGLGFRIALYL